MAATVHNIELEEGCTFELAVAVVTPSGQPRSLLGFTGQMDIRDDPESPDTLLEATVAVDAVAGLVVATIPAASLADLQWAAGVYDLIITNGTRTQKLVRGEVTVIQTVTR